MSGEGIPASTRASAPIDNPFFVEAGERDPASTRHTVWSIGHRTGQGLASHPRTGALWHSEMGLRGGDEVNFQAHLL